MIIYFKFIYVLPLSLHPPKQTILRYQLGILSQFGGQLKYDLLVDNVLLY